MAGEKVGAALKYHGILGATCAPDGELYFMRNGQRCKLFTKDFIDYWRGECTAKINSNSYKHSS